MKTLILLLFTIIFFGCFKEKIPHQSPPFPLLPLKHATLGFELAEPGVILNEMAKGELDSNIHSILSQSFSNSLLSTENYWGFEYMRNSNRVSQMTYYVPHYSGCEKEKFKFYYNVRNMIDSIVSTRVNCGGFTATKLFTFNYNKSGLLKSIFMDNESFLEENYIGYYPNGKVKEIYNDFRGRGIAPNFGVQRFYYDKTFENIIRATNMGLDYNYSYQYSYDKNRNPFKTFFIAVSINIPVIGAGSFLSKNNASKQIEKNERNIYGTSDTSETLFNFSNSGTMLNYKSLGKNAGNYLLYTIH